MRNVARCWCYETGRMLGDDLEDKCVLLDQWTKCMRLSCKRAHTCRDIDVADAREQPLGLGMRPHSCMGQLVPIQNSGRWLLSYCYCWHKCD